MGLYGNISYDVNGYVDDAELIDDTGDPSLKAVTGYTGDIAYAGGVLSFGSSDLVLADDCELFVNDGGSAKSVTAARVDNDYEDDAPYMGAIYWVVDNNVVIEVYLNSASLPADKTEEEVTESAGEAISDDDGAWGEVDGVAGVYAPEGTWQQNEDGSITATYGNGEKNETAVMNDTARYLGSLHRNGGAEKIEYAGKTYVWDDNEPLKGSNWYDASYPELTKGDNANTLVKALDDANVFAGSSLVLTVDGVRLTINFVESGD